VMMVMMMIMNDDNGDDDDERPGGWERRFIVFNAAILASGGPVGSLNFVWSLCPPPPPFLWCLPRARAS
jgi:hypothetical protein